MPFAEVLVNHAYARRQEHFTYEVPTDLEVEAGSGVVVPFQRGEKAGLVLRVHDEKPEFETRKIQELIGSESLLLPWQMELSNWLVDYYFCSKYDALKLMLPKHIWRKPKQERKSKEKAAKNKEAVLHELTPTQDTIVTDILEKGTHTALIHGVTGSGKTEIYKRLILAKVKAGQQALLLVPEIALTPQLVHEFEAHFPNLAVIHSRVSEGQRAKTWKAIRQGLCPLVIGSRSALFSPFKNLGIMIMDEEHEWTYKQDQSPRYHARTAAEKVSQLTGATLVLGSATPSIESMWAAQSGQYKYHHLEERIAGTPLPQVHLVDMREELKAKNFSMFSELLEQKICSALANKEQIVLFLNRRGSASATLCRDCGQASECHRCDTKLTYHARTTHQKSLICHHCGHIEAVPSTCTNCESTRIKQLGSGTQSVESELQKRFPTARIFRADKDSMSQKDSFSILHDKLKNHEIDILIGTQMITKGWDIPNVTLVGVLLADMGLHIPDFRAAERSFQLLTQVAGRAGRREKQGEVVIQSYNPEHPSIAFTQEHDYLNFYKQEVAEREQAAYPPFGQLVKLIHVNKDKKAAYQAAEQVKEKLATTEHAVYAAPALIPRIKDKYYWHVLIQGPQAHKALTQLTPEDLEGWRIDVDPIHSV